MTGPEHERSDIIHRLSKAAGILEQSMAPCLISPGNSNIACAIRGARDGRDVAAVSGGLRDVQGSVHCTGPVVFGADPPITRKILTTMKFDPAIRSGAVIRFSAEIWSILSDMFMECAKTGPSDARVEPGLLDWAIASCCSEGIPDVILLQGRIPESTVIWMPDEELERLTSNILILSNRIH